MELYKGMYYIYRGSDKAYLSPSIKEELDGVYYERDKVIKRFNRIVNDYIKLTHTDRHFNERSTRLFVYVIYNGKTILSKNIYSYDWLRTIGSLEEPLDIKETI